MYDSNYPQMKILETKRCILRPITLNDVKDIFECYKKDIVVKYLPFNRHKNINDSKRFIKTFFLSNYNQGKIGHLAVVFKSDNKVIGNVGFNNIYKGSIEGEMGICINSDYWGHDLSTELAIEMLRYGFKDLKLNKIIAVTFEKNSHSRKPLETLGFYYLGRFSRKFYYTKPAKNVICHKYEMLRKDYLKKK